MLRVLVCISFASILAVGTSLTTSSSAQLLQPNIVFVMLDDVGFADLSYNNEDTMIPTPNIDELVRKGVKLNWHYSHPTCTPSRASLMTAKYSANVGLPFAMASVYACIYTVYVF
jgi:hypothetical protein